MGEWQMWCSMRIDNEADLDILETSGGQLTVRHPDALNAITFSNMHAAVRFCDAIMAHIRGSKLYASMAADGQAPRVGPVDTR
jgi:hypothetical protein